MVEEPKRTLAYICPSCRQPVVIERSLFQLAASESTLSCPCGHSKLHIVPGEDRVKITVPCLFCQKDHVVSCSTHAFLHERALAFSCAASGLDCCYVGEESAVFLVMRRLEETLDKLETEAGQAGSFLDEIVMKEVLSELKEIASRGGVSCTCGAGEFKMKIKFSTVELICAQCGGTLRIPAAVADDIDAICCKRTLTIHRRREEGH